MYDTGIIPVFIFLLQCFMFVYKGKIKNLSKFGNSRRNPLTENFFFRKYIFTIMYICVLILSRLIC
jgi:hypothetical protein